VLVIVIKS